LNIEHYKLKRFNLSSDTATAEVVVFIPPVARK